jgi:hypothetical protein
MAAKSKVVPGTDETSAGATEVNGQLINATGIRQNADTEQNSGNAESRKGDKNKKTTEGTIDGKEKSKNRRELSTNADD